MDNLAVAVIAGGAGIGRIAVGAGIAVAVVVLEVAVAIVVIEVAEVVKARRAVRTEEVVIRERAVALLQPGTRDVEQKDIDDKKTCRICLDGFEKPGRIYNHTIEATANASEIDHSYHYDCMLKWAVVCIKNNPNTPNPITCPLCNLKITAS